MLPGYLATFNKDFNSDIYVFVWETHIARAHLHWI
jgi:hypothetical protein